MALAICLSTVVLPALGGETIRPRWPRPMGDDQVEQAGGQLVAVGFQVKALLREDRRQVLEVRPLFGRFRVEAVDRLHPQQAVSTSRCPWARAPVR